MSASLLKVHVPPASRAIVTSSAEPGVDAVAGEPTATLTDPAVSRSTLRIAVPKRDAALPFNTQLASIPLAVGSDRRLERTTTIAPAG